MTIDKQSWGHRDNVPLEGYLTCKELIDGEIHIFGEPYRRLNRIVLLFSEIVTTVSCGGNILVNVGPSKSGTIEAIFADRLRCMGR